MSTPRTVSVLGSCLSRDVFNSRFNPTWREHFSTGPTTNQSSIIALMSPPVTEPFEPTKSMSDYDRWNVSSDLRREVLAELSEAGPDVVVLDFFADVWFGVARLPDGRYLTDNRWKTHHTDLYQRHARAGELDVLTFEKDADAYLELWADSLARLADHLAIAAPRAQVVVHRGWITDRVVVPDRPRPQPLARHLRTPGFDVAGKRAFWDRLDDHAVSTHGWASIDLRDQRTPTRHDHPWGPFWVHYLDEYYHAFLAELLGLVVTPGLDDEVRVLLDLTRAAAQEPWRRRLESERQVVARRDHQLELLRDRAAVAGPEARQLSRLVERALRLLRRR